MVENQRPRSGSRYSLNPLTAAVLDAIPPLGYKRPPPLIGSNTVTHAHRLLRAKKYAQAYKSITIPEWNAYITFGIQQFDSPAKYFAQYPIRSIPSTEREYCGPREILSRHFNCLMCLCDPDKPTFTQLVCRKQKYLVEERLDYFQQFEPLR